MRGYRDSGMRAAVAIPGSNNTRLNVGFAGIIAMGVVYNSARVSLSERTRELAPYVVLIVLA